ncbi:MAG: SDR family oxidoreductase [Candidatus Aminicenantes bacterium]|nr:SDR family oxidoreductase [Candidatus Aminicenantes bacterium]
MENRVVLITGSSRGIGKDIALKFAGSGADVAIHYLGDRKSALGVARTVRDKGGRSAVFRADLTKERDAASLIRRVQEKFGRIDVLVNNVGPLHSKPWEETTTAEWEAILRSNLMSALFCMRAVLPDMRKKKWGRIINLGYSRVEQLSAYSQITPYAIAKTGLLILTRSVAASEADSKITVNMVSPGLMEGGDLPKNTRIPAGRLGRYEDVSSSVLFLASDDAGYITGTNLIVAGGWKL